MEQDADVVMFLHEEKNEHGHTSPTEPAAVKLIIGKHRNGSMGQLNLSFDKQHSRFVEAVESGDSGYPSDSKHAGNPAVDANFYKIICHMMKFKNISSHSLGAIYKALYVPLLLLQQQ